MAFSEPLLKELHISVLTSFFMLNSKVDIDNFHCFITTPTTCSILSAITPFHSIPTSLSHNNQSYDVQAISDRILITCLASQIAIPDTVHEIIRSQAPDAEPDSKDWSGNLQTIIIPNSILSIDSEAFSNCQDLITLTFTDESQLKTLDGFHNCTFLVTVKLPPLVEVIAKDCFLNCARLSNVNLADALHLREIHGFRRCYSLRDIVIPPFVEVIGKDGFENCTRLTRFASDWMSVEDGGSDDSESDTKDFYKHLQIEFAQDSHLKDISGFNKCIIWKIEIPDSVEVINGFNGITYWTKEGDYTSCLGVSDVQFGKGSRLREINGFSPPCMMTLAFPDSLEVIGPDAFAGWSFDRKRYLIPEGPLLQELEFGSGSHLRVINGISGCPYLSEVHLPDSVETMGGNSFLYCNEGPHGYSPDGEMDIYRV
jgi:hypothetical protein